MKIRITDIFKSLVKQTKAKKTKQKNKKQDNQKITHLFILLFNYILCKFYLQYIIV